jgi:heme-degrading monooxygenase HmoA
MYALMSSYSIGFENRQTAEKMADQADPAFKSMKGFVSAFYLGDDAVGEYISFSVWKSKEDAEAARAAIAPRMDQVVRDLDKAPAARRLFEVYEAKA